eukprot:Gb_20279 [translate_table: standard]
MMETDVAGENFLASVKLQHIYRALEQMPESSSSSISGANARLLEEASRYFVLNCQSTLTNNNHQTSMVVILYIDSCSVVLPWKMARNCEVVHPELLNNCTLQIDAQEKIDNNTYLEFFYPGPFKAKQTLYPVWRPTELAAVAAGNPDRLVDGVSTIGMLLTLVKADTAASYPGILAEDEGRDPDYYCSLACLRMRQRFRYGRVLYDDYLNGSEEGERRVWMYCSRQSQVRDCPPS